MDEYWPMVRIVKGRVLFQGVAVREIHPKEKNWQILLFQGPILTTRIVKRIPSSQPSSLKGHYDSIRLQYVGRDPEPTSSYVKSTESIKLGHVFETVKC